MTTVRRPIESMVRIGSTQRIDINTIASPPPWMADGTCTSTDPEIFFPEKGGSTRSAKETCAGCPVRVTCLEYALKNQERFGIWGGGLRTGAPKHGEASLMTVKALRGLVSISLDEIRPSPNNPREQLTGIDDLATSIREVGLIQPLIVQKIPGFDGFQIVAGHRRFAALHKNGAPEAPCVVRRDMLPDEELLAMLVENGQRAGLDPIEEARALSRLKKGGHTTPEIAQKIGRSGTYVNGRLMLLTLPPEEQDAVRAGHYTVSHAQDLVRAERRDERQRVNPVARPVGRPKGATTKPYFGDTHPLAKAARAACDHRTVKVGGTACGECWESVIRADERQIHRAPQDGAA